ncbi:transposase [Candidatus Poriferisodalis sp.]|uniref:transposase n=1 Tax=Candidatus Poriferisodalis sp. TaxID=3101277 RepID=UPI003B0203E3
MTCASTGRSTKPPAEANGPARGPVDRRKLGWKTSIAVDGSGIPVGWAADCANRNDITLLDPTADQIVARGLHHDVDTVHLDRGYSGARVDDTATAAGITDLVRPPRRKPRRRLC